MRRKPMMALSVLCFAALSSACAKAEPEIVKRIEYVPQTIPAVLLSCPEAPAVPDPATATQRTVAAYLVETVHAGEDCRAKLEAVGRLVTEG